MLFFTTVFVLLAELLIYFPSAARQYHDLLAARLASAQIAVLALDEVRDTDLSPELRREILANAGVRLVGLKRNNTRRLYLAESIPPAKDVEVDLRTAGMVELIWDSLDCMVFGDDRVLRVLGVPRLGAGDLIEALIDEAPVRAEMISFSTRILGLSLLIAAVTSGLVFAALYYLFVRPMQHLTQSMVRFQERPEDAQRIIVPTLRADEIGQSERVLAAMQTELRQALQQREHLAALGTAVAKIQHDLRNILASAQLASDRLATSKDPTTQAIAPRLVSSIDRAIALATNTLKYGRAEEAPPRRRRQKLLAIADEAMHAALAAGDGRTGWNNAFDSALEVDADNEQLLRILINVGRNAAQALEAREGAAITLSAHRTNNVVTIDLSDNGAGVPEEARKRLFEPFAGKGRVGGTGLGLAIARELARGHGGEVALLSSGDNGTTFRITIPDVAALGDGPP
ncbi:MAG: HAMP domain-containing histidine kinase [Alphaproteobacteria bacterium]|nr:HAMP domain-containing histidine kinase [Alphaproteobacteria bacterium]